MAIDWFPLWLSLRVAAIATVLAMALGIWLAYLLAFRQFRGKQVLDALVTLPLLLPSTVLGFYLLVLLGRKSPLGALYETVTGSPLLFTWQAAVLAALTHSLPLVVHSTRQALETVDRRYGRAARSLGASEWQVFQQVTLPLAARPVLAAAAIAFARSLADFGVTLLIAGNVPGRTQTLAVAVYDAVQKGEGAIARTLVLAISALALAALWIANRLAPAPLRMAR